MEQGKGKFGSSWSEEKYAPKPNSYNKMITFCKAFDNALYQNSLHMKLIAIFVGILSSRSPATLSSCQPILASLLSSPTK